MSTTKKDIFDMIRSISFHASEGTRLKQQLRKLNSSLDIRRSNRGTNGITIDLRDSDDRDICIDADRQFVSDLIEAVSAYIERCEDKVKELSQAL